MSRPRVAVVGGGITGTLASLVLRNRGIQAVLIDQGRDVGGRLRGSYRSKLYQDSTTRIDSGAQFLRCNDIRLLSVFRMLEENNLLRKWDGRFGLLGSQGGGFLPSSVVGQATGMRKDDNTKDEEQSLPDTIDSGDFCSFVANHNPKTPTYVGIPDNNSLCQQICHLAQIDKISNTQVIKAMTQSSGGWLVHCKNGEDGKVDASLFDALILATHDPTIAAQSVQSIVEAEIDAEAIDESDDDKKAHKFLLNRLKNLIKDLKDVRQSRKPIFTWSGRFTHKNDPDFDAVSVPGSNLIQFLARESSKPGRQTKEMTGVWTAVSTSQLAQDILRQGRKKNGRTPEEDALEIMSHEVTKLLFGNGTLSSQSSLPVPESASVVKWGSAFTSKSLGLNEESILLNQWRLAIAGDFIRSLDAHSTPLEAAALSGLEAGERIAALFGDTSMEQRPSE